MLTIMPAAFAGLQDTLDLSKLPFQYGAASFSLEHLSSKYLRTIATSGERDWLQREPLLRTVEQELCAKSKLTWDIHNGKVST